MPIWMIIVIIVILIAVFALEREIYYFDGVHLGSRIQGWLYNRWAAKYDADKKKSQSKDEESLIRPLLSKLQARRVDLAEVLVLDVATGTGRFPCALFQQAEFTGRVIGVDISLGMLQRGHENLAGHANRVELLHQPAIPLPFPDNTFTVVSCLEFIELIPNIELTVKELARVLRPGGILLTSCCTKKWGYDMKLRSPEEFTALLQGAGLDSVQISPWWEWFQLVFAEKPGQLATQPPTKLIDMLRCAQCGKIEWSTPASGEYVCNNCGGSIKSTPEGILTYSGG
jgi:ubiquinone/menaquinone biosynthesis C-methylase UbiE